MILVHSCTLVQDEKSQTHSIARWAAGESLNYSSARRNTSLEMYEA